jgi:hypothetical protein
MKKNAMLKIAAILMVAVLLTTCAISSTFAKYVTTGDTVTETTRIAKWGVTLVTDASGLFLNQYDTDDDGSVVSADRTDVIAPGTTNTASITTDLQGSPEVALEITTAATVTLTGWAYNNSVYCPLVFVVNGTTYSIRVDDPATDNNEAETVEQFAARVEAAIEAAGTAQFAPDTYAATSDAEAADIAVVVTWTWDFSVNDEADTYFGNAAAGTISGVAAPTVSVVLTQTATQIDTYEAPATETESESSSESV